MRFYKKFLLGAMSLLTVGGLASCGDDKKPESGHEHTVVVDQAVAATCDKTGLTEGSHCSECGEKIVKQEVVPALGHDGMVCSRCNASTISKEFYNTMVNSVDLENGVVLSIPSCSMNVTTTEGAKVKNSIYVPEIYVNLSSSKELYGRFVETQEVIDASSKGGKEVNFKLEGDLFIVTQEVFEYSEKNEKVVESTNTEVYPVSYIMEKFESLYNSLTSVMGSIDSIKESFAAISNAANALNSNISTSLINTIFEAKVNGESYEVSLSKKLLGNIAKETANYLNNSSVEDVVNDLVKSVLGDTLYNKLFTNGAFAFITNTEIIGNYYDEAQSLLSGVKVEEALQMAEAFLEEKLGFVDENDPYYALRSTAALLDQMISERIVPTDGMISNMLETVLGDIPDITLYELVLSLSSNALEKENVMAALQYLSGIKDEKLLGFILSSMGVEITQEQFNAYLLLTVEELNKVSNLFDFTLTTTKAGVIQGASMKVNSVTVDNTQYDLELDVSFGKYTSQLEYTAITGSKAKYDAFKSSLKELPLAKAGFPNGLEFVGFGTDKNSIILKNVSTNETVEYVMNDVMTIEDYNEYCYYVIYYVNGTDEIKVEASYQGENNTGVYISSSNQGESLA